MLTFLEKPLSIVGFFFYPDQWSVGALMQYYTNIGKIPTVPISQLVN